MLNLQAHATVMGAVAFERTRQERLKAQGRFTFTPDEVDTVRASAMLTEECGEVARAALAITGTVQETLTEADLYTELTHVAAVAVAIAEGILRRKGDPIIDRLMSGDD